MDLKEITLRLSQAGGVSGAEGQAAPLARELLSPFGEVSVTPLGSVAVSYTHLDVYKRQAQNGPTAKLWNTWPVC